MQRCAPAHHGVPGEEQWEQSRDAATVHCFIILCTYRSALSLQQKEGWAKIKCFPTGRTRLQMLLESQASSSGGFCQISRLAIRKSKLEEVVLKWVKNFKISWNPEKNHLKCYPKIFSISWTSAAISWLQDIHNKRASKAHWLLTTTSSILTRKWLLYRTSIHSCQKLRASYDMLLTVVSGI